MTVYDASKCDRIFLICRCLWSVVEVSPVLLYCRILMLYLFSPGGSSRVCYLDDECDDDVTKVMRNTGDLVREEDGSLYFVGREDEQIKRQGKRVNPIELENVNIDTSFVHAPLSYY